MIDDNKEIPRGPEDIPSRAGLVKGIKLVILIKDLKSGRRIREERIDWDDFDARKWLGRMTYHAIINGYSVETMNEKDYIVEV